MNKDGIAKRQIVRFESLSGGTIFAHNPSFGDAVDSIESQQTFLRVRLSTFRNG
jgi:hypothetical protein